ncbi:uncharacterized protein DUF4037 [Kribbella steppae]|uniref:Uncharacterized protein DUF4037 n=1 Tax=Kribbella steppae TaxID=2512223 RepID=A0A4R2HHX2_9ACTN|nr:DUF4037 domain-containing protein [Kribbella steppae]TCO28479.1 uncharacterized protein DUF4037 [Kribbella steppae]
MDGRGLARAYYDDVVGPLLAAKWPELQHAAGRLGGGSDVLGLDDATSRDHDWGLRLTLLVDEASRDEVDAYLAAELPKTYAGLPTHFPFTGQTESIHHVEVASAEGFVRGRLGFDPRDELSTIDWLTVTGQAVLEVVGGPVFVDQVGDISAVRDRLQWYPDDVWRYVLACDWLRLQEEMPLMSRAGDLGDDIGSRVIAARLVDVAVHLAFMIERRWPPYPKWRGTLFAELPCAREVGDALRKTLKADHWRYRQQQLGRALEHLLNRQRAVGLPAPGPATVDFFDRPYLHANDAIIATLLADAPDLPRGRGSVEQRTDNVAVLVDPAARRAAVTHP